MVSSALGTYLSPQGRECTELITIVSKFKKIPGTYLLTSQKRTSYTCFQVFVRYKLDLGGRIISPDGKFLFKDYVHIYTPMGKAHESSSKHQ